VTQFSQPNGLEDFDCLRIEAFGRIGSQRENGYPIPKDGESRCCGINILRDVRFDQQLPGASRGSTAEEKDGQQTTAIAQNLHRGVIGWNGRGLKTKPPGRGHLPGG
jgi:hypothetical protein